MRRQSIAVLPPPTTTTLPGSLGDQLLAFAAHAGGLPAADGDRHGVELLLQLFQLKVLAELAVEDELHAHLLEVGEFAVEDRLRQPVLRNAVAEHAARLGHRFEDRRGHAVPAQIVGGGESGRTGADDGDLLTGFRRKLFHVGVVVKVGSETLELIDGDRLAVDVATALLLAEAGADPADRHRQRNALLDDLQAFEKLPFAPGADVLFDVGVGRAGHGAGRFAVAGVFAQQQIERGAAHVEHLVAGGVDLLPLGRAGRAGGQETTGFLILHHTDETAGGAGDALFAAEGRDLDPVRLRHFENGLARFRADGPAVQDKFDTHYLEPFITRLIAFFGQTSRQLLQRVHFSLSITKLSEMAPTGQVLMQSRHLTHLL